MEDYFLYIYTFLGYYLKNEYALGLQFLDISFNPRNYIHSSYLGPIVSNQSTLPMHSAQLKGTEET
jgi:hypothetical protein